MDRLSWYDCARACAERDFTWYPAQVKTATLHCTSSASALPICASVRPLNRGHWCVSAACSAMRADFQRNLMHIAYHSYVAEQISSSARMLGSSFRLKHGHTHRSRRVRASTTCATQTSDAPDAKALFVQASPETSELFSSVKRWIVFSDLHVHQRFHPHWRSSLNSVSKIASAHNAGCIFLVRRSQIYVF